MASTSCNDRAERLLEMCLAGRPWPPELLRELADDECSEALVRVVVEGLADRFEPALCDTYAALMAAAIAPGESAALEERYRRVRVVRAIDTEPRRVFVLSRVTLGADVAVTSVILDAAKRRFPDAEICLVGPRKNGELFAADPRIQHRTITYRRGTLRDRLAVLPELRAAVDEPDSIVIDPDSRLTQLGLLPVCPEERYYFFESRAYGRDSDDSLVELAAQWAGQVFGIRGARAYLAPAPADTIADGGITVSLGTGENAAKRIGDEFEEALLRLLATRGEIWIDRGAGGEEAARVERAISRSGARVQTWSGSFAGFASLIAQSKLYAGYDSAGQHVAAACGTPLVTVFAGFASRRMLARWRPTGGGPIAVIEGSQAETERVLDQVRRAVDGMR